MTMRVLVVVALCLASAGCATAPSGRYVAVTTQAVAKMELPQVMSSASVEPQTITISVILRGGRSQAGRIAVEWSSERMSTMSDSELVLLRYSRDEIVLGGNFLGQATHFRRVSDDAFSIGSIVFRRQSESNQSVQPNAGSHPPSGDLPASETSSSLGPRG